MKQEHQKQYAGLWMDTHEAILITQENGDFTLGDKVKADQYHGYSGEHGAMNAEKADNRKYYKALASHILKYDEVLIFGPGKSQEAFLNFLHEDQHFKNKKITLDTSGNITDPQMIAKVRDFFND